MRTTLFQYNSGHTSFLSSSGAAASFAASFSSRTPRESILFIKVGMSKQINIHIYRHYISMTFF